MREFRAVWVATVANIDWPSRKGLPVAQQKEELLRILDVCKDVGLNAVVFQVRPMCDALYESPHEPWSEFLSGMQGVAPSPKYDPLEFAALEAHQRGLELHAWFNPYRAWQPAANGKPDRNHLSVRRPDLVRSYGRHLWLDPGEQEVLDHSMEVILDVVRRYNVDGIHVDDYFYPYPESDAEKKPIPFPDDASYAKYKDAGGRMQRDDWRRDNVNRFIKRMYEQTREAKPWVKVGISPFGIWRPGQPPGIQGFDQYGRLYADAKLWFEQGWVDYMTPQLYWPIKQEEQSYPKLLGWWAEQNRMKRHLWPGDSISRVSEKLPSSEYRDEIDICRKRGDATGNVHFSMKALLADKHGIADELKRAYSVPALVPASPWMTREAPLLETPRASIKGKSLTFDQPSDDVRQFVVAHKSVGKWSHTLVPAKTAGGKPSTTLPEKTERVAFAVVDRFGRMTSWREIKQ